MALKPFDCRGFRGEQLGWIAGLGDPEEEIAENATYTGFNEQRCGREVGRPVLGCPIVARFARFGFHSPNVRQGRAGLSSAECMTRTKNRPRRGEGLYCPRLPLDVQDPVVTQPNVAFVGFDTGVSCHVGSPLFVYFQCCSIDDAFPL